MRAKTPGPRKKAASKVATKAKAKTKIKAKAKAKAKVKAVDKAVRRRVSGGVLILKCFINHVHVSLHSVNRSVSDLNALICHF